MVDFKFLRERGIELLQQICGESWTDYNLHDPGVTILEVLCYALTDLSYRTEFPMQDLLADKEGKIRLRENAFFPREDILSTNPVSVADCRKFILDQLDELHNVWLEPYMSEFSFGTMHGLYTIKVQVKKELSVNLKTVDGSPLKTVDGQPPKTVDGQPPKTVDGSPMTTGAVQPPDDAWEDKLTKKVRACFVSARNLCEDIIRHITILHPIPIHIQAEVVIDGDGPETILAHIYRDLETAINLPVRYYSERELLEKGFLMEDIHAGPHLRKGFIRDDELPDRKQFIDPAELMKAIAAVPGVGYVRSLTVFTPEGPTDRTPYRLPPDSYPYFREGLRDSPVRLLHGKYVVQINEPVFNDIWPRVMEAASRSIQPVVVPQDSPEIRHGQYRDVMTYHSLQHLFPVVYGIGRNGLGRHPSAARTAKARQLKGYLLSFEQLLANYLAQLAHLPDFFSPGNTGRTYYTQPLYDVPDVRYLLKAFTASGDPVAWNTFMADRANGYATTLMESAETEEDYRERRNAVLDHLLARFNLQPSDYPVKLYSRLYRRQYAASAQDRLGGQDKPAQPDEVLEWKSSLLKNIAGLSYNRVRGFDYLAGNRHDNGGFYEYMMALLYVPDRSSANLSAAVMPHLTPPPSPAAPGQSPSFAGRRMSFFQQGLHAANYSIGREPDGQGWRILFKEPADPNAHPDANAHSNTHAADANAHSRANPHAHAHSRANAAAHAAQLISRHPDEPSAKEALIQTIDRLRRISMLSEGFYVIEHVLLRPPIDSDSFGFRFMATQKEMLLQHAHWTSFTRREDILTEILNGARHATPSPSDHTASAASPSNPSSSGSSPSTPAPSNSVSSALSQSEWGVKCLRGRCRIQLTRHKEFGFLSDPADFEPWLWAEAAPDIDYIRRQLLLFNENRLRFYPRFEMLVRGPNDKPIREEFYNFNMTVLLPAWPARFQGQDFRAFAMDLFRQHTPAHIRLYFQWLNISRMAEFEEIYPQWITAMKDQDDAATRQHWCERIIHFIKKGVY